MNGQLLQYREELEQELKDILQYWIDHTIDNANGGFVGKIDHKNKIYPNADKGSVLNSRILWSFSAAYNLTGDKKYLEIAERAFEYILQHFIDKVFGGVYWSIGSKGEMVDSKKQIYALSFAIYALSEYYKTSANHLAKEKAIALYNDIVKYSYDKENGGYIEALTRDWQSLNDLRLSEKDFNERKSMNTHLHVLEAFSNLMTIWESDELENKVKELVEIFINHIICHQTNHLVLFFDDEWQQKSKIISYGHDIEAAWLIQEAAEKIKDESLLSKVKQSSLAIADSVLSGIDDDGGLWYEFDIGKNHLVKEKHSWPQAEAMIGYFNAYQLTGDERYLKRSMKSWDFVKKHIRDKEDGEWYWGVKADYSVMDHEDKVGIWKCPYHNSRACIEIIQRINQMPDKK